MRKIPAALDTVDALKNVSEALWAIADALTSIERQFTTDCDHNVCTETFRDSISNVVYNLEIISGISDIKEGTSK